MDPPGVPRGRNDRPRRRPARRLPGRRKCNGGGTEMLRQRSKGSAPRLCMPPPSACPVPPESTASDPGARLPTYNTVKVDGLDVFYREAGNPDAPKLPPPGRLPVILTPVPQPPYRAGGQVPPHQLRLPRLRQHHDALTRPAGTTPSTTLLDIFVDGAAVTGFTGPMGIYMQAATAARSNRLIEVPPTGWRGRSSRTPTPTKRALPRRGTASATCRGGTALPKRRCPSRRSFEHDTVKAIDPTGHPNPAKISPADRGTWTRAHRVQLDLFYDYRTNPARDPAWQERLRTTQPNTIIFWGQGVPPARAATPTCGTSPRPGSSSSSPVTSPPRTALRRSPRASADMTVWWPLKLVISQAPAPVHRLAARPGAARANREKGTKCQHPPQAITVPPALSTPVPPMPVRQWPKMRELVRGRGAHRGAGAQFALKSGGVTACRARAAGEWSCDYGDGGTHGNVTIAESGNGTVQLPTTGGTAQTPAWRQGRSEA